MQERLNVLRNAYGYREVAITDSDGKALLSAPDNIALLDDSARQTVRQALVNNGPRLSPIHFAGSAGNAVRVVEIATPLLHSLDETE